MSNYFSRVLYASNVFTDIHDHDKTGTININEFQQLFQSINQWKAVFESHDHDRSGRIEQNELNQGEIFITAFHWVYVVIVLNTYSMQNRLLQVVVVVST